MSQPGADFIAAFAEQLPTRVICRLLGVPMSDFADFHQWSIAIGRVFSGPSAFTPEAVQATNDGVDSLRQYMSGLVRLRLHSPGDDFLSTLVQAHQAGNLSEDEVIDQAVVLVWAGQDTTSHQLGCLAHTFANHPQQWDLIIRTRPWSTTPSRRSCGGAPRRG